MQHLIMLLESGLWNSLKQHFLNSGARLPCRGRDEMLEEARITSGNRYRYQFQSLQQVTIG